MQVVSEVHEFYLGPDVTPGGALIPGQCVVQIVAPAADALAIVMGKAGHRLLDIDDDVVVKAVVAVDRDPRQDRILFADIVADDLIVLAGNPQVPVTQAVAKGAAALQVGKAALRARAVAEVAKVVAVADLIKVDPRRPGSALTTAMVKRQQVAILATIVRCAQIVVAIVVATAIIG